MSLVDLWLTSHEVRRPFPLSGRRRMQLRTVAGVVELQVLHGQDPGAHHWGCPVRERWGLTSHQQLSPALEDKLDFYHASQHLWELGRALHGGDEAAIAQWVEPRRHQLRHGKEKQVQREIAGLKPPAGQAGEILRREQNYFASHAGRMSYQQLHRQWTGRTGVPPKAMPVQKARSVLDAQRHATSGRTHRSPPQPSLGRTLASHLIRGLCPDAPALSDRL